MSEELRMKLAIYNPLNAEIHALPVIYGFNNGGREGIWDAQLIAEDGAPLGSHICSHEGFMPGDLGCVEGWRRDDRHEGFKKHYPDGYRTAFVSYDDVKSHEGLQDAIKKYNENTPETPDSVMDAKVTITVGE